MIVDSGWERSYQNEYDNDDREHRQQHPNTSFCLYDDDEDETWTFQLIYMKIQVFLESY